MTIAKPFLLSVVANLVFATTTAYAIPFSVVANGPLPTYIPPGGVASASYIVTNNTRISAPFNSVRYLPPNVQINPSTTTCAPTSHFILHPNASCRLDLTITGPVSRADANPHNHLFICMSDGITCGGPNPDNSLNITMTTKITPILYGVSGVGVAMIPAHNILYKINPDTAVVTTVMPLTYEGSESNIASDGNILYHFSGLGPILKAMKSPVQRLEQINLNTLTTNPVTLSGQTLGNTYGAVFYRNANAFLVTNGGASNQFNTVATNGISTVIGSTSTDYIVGLACYQHRIYGATPNGSTLGIANSELLELNPANGATISSKPITMNGVAVNGVMGLTVNPNTGVFYALIWDNAPGLKKTSLPPQSLATIDVNTGAATLIGSLNGVFMTSIAFNPADSNC